MVIFELWNFDKFGFVLCAYLLPRKKIFSVILYKKPNEGETDLTKFSFLKCFLE